ncbi:MAG: glycosyltransferase family 2 protein [Chloroflexi bacterium]|nr:glycosyltransferase family 2 protein [Chloroflexota bacterium]
MDLSTIIINFNTPELLRGCLRSLEATVPATLAHKIIVVDNGSADESWRSLADEFRGVRLIRNERNLGFARANNQGVEASTGRYVLFLNSDTVVQPGTLQTMVRFLDGRPDVGAATCRVDLPDGRLDDAAHRSFPTPWNALTHFSGISRLFPRSSFLSGYSLGWVDLAEDHEIDALAGCFMLVRREAGDAVGWWDEDYFFYGEDLDFCYRLKARGWKIYFVPDVSILHYKGSSSGIRRESRAVSRADRVTRVRATLARFDAMKLFYAKHYAQRYPRLLRWLVMRAIDLKQWVALRSL